MEKNRQTVTPNAAPCGEDTPDLCIDPSGRLCPKFDFTSIAEFRVADREHMGLRVLDNCAEEHIM
jgi:negative regulator of sigma E activity